ncbi:hypothetical protein [Rubrolithibacter danxiaensis]|uniref:hypothetical protein n=1 Tax=Rubrolithibacter danxiaensis TaxID=3390805 RepID=UPI003BF870AB
MRNSLPFILFALFFSAACRVILISGYDPVIDETCTKIKREFNLHFIKLSRTLQDTNPDNQRFENFQDYYDNVETDLLILEDRAKFLDNKSALVRKQISNMDSAFHVFISLHKNGLKDTPADDRRDIRNGINSSIDAVIKLQEELKTTGRFKSPK